jgi:cytoskeletal protein CcmA (bactofilin family)
MTYSAKRNFVYLVASLVCLLWLGAPSVDASSVIRTGDTLSISEDQLIEGDFYSATGKMNFSGAVQGDAIIASPQVTINGNIDKDAALFGGTVDVYGTVGDDLRVVAGETTIAEPVMGDVLVIGGVLTILSSASVAGDVILVTGQATIEGSVGGDILGWSDILRIDAPVAGDVSVTVSALTLGDKANISGSVQYVSRELAVQAQNAIVEGDLVRNDPVVPAVSTSLGEALIPVLMILFSVLAWYLISRKSLTAITNKALRKSVRPALLGFASVILVPFAIVLLTVSVIGMLVGITLFFLYALLLMLALIALPALIGQAMLKLFSRPTKELTLVSLVVGVFGVMFLAVLPIIGALVLSPDEFNMMKKEYWKRLITN